MQTKLLTQTTSITEMMFRVAYIVQQKPVLENQISAPNL
jgi:hypothetical protein